MNANEVIATLAGEGAHPNDHVNMGQSSNDVFPSAVHLAALSEATNDLLPALEQLEASFAAKAVDFHDIVKSGRTHLMDAVPVTLGQGSAAMPHRYGSAHAACASRCRRSPRSHSVARRPAPGSTLTRSSPRKCAPCLRRTAAWRSPRRSTRSRRRATATRSSSPLSGALTPGSLTAPLGTFTINGDLAFNSGSGYGIQIAPGAGNNSATDVNGTATLGGNGTVVVKPALVTTRRPTIRS